MKEKLQHLCTTNDSTTGIVKKWNICAQTETTVSIMNKKKMTAKCPSSNVIHTVWQQSPVIHYNSFTFGKTEVTQKNHIKTCFVPQVLLYLWYCFTTAAKLAGRGKSNILYWLRGWSHSVTTWKHWSMSGICLLIQLLKVPRTNMSLTILNRLHSWNGVVDVHCKQIWDSLSWKHQ